MDNIKTDKEKELEKLVKKYKKKGLDLSPHLLEDPKFRAEIDFFLKVSKLK